jgi:hypothetical protein
MAMQYMANAALWPCWLCSAVGRAPVQIGGTTASGEARAGRCSNGSPKRSEAWRRITVADVPRAPRLWCVVRVVCGAWRVVPGVWCRGREPTLERVSEARGQRLPRRFQ